MQTNKTRKTQPNRPNVHRVVLCLVALATAMAAPACGGEVGQWDPELDPLDPSAPELDVAVHEPDPENVASSVDEGLAGIEGWDEELAEWEQQNPGQQVGGGDVADRDDGVGPDDSASDDSAGGGPTIPLAGGCRDASGGKTMHLTMLQVGKLARKVGIPCGPRLATAIAIAGAESANYKRRWHKNTNCTTDIGLWQINDYYHPRYAKFNLITNATGMKRISGKGRRWTAWYARNTDAFRKYRKYHACDAAQKICGWTKKGDWRKRHCFCNLSNCN